MGNISLTYKIIYICAFIIIIYIIKPSIVFKEDNTLRDYGVGYDETGHKKSLYNLQFIIIIVALILSIFK